MVNKVHLMRCLFNLKMLDSTIIANHLNELAMITTQLVAVDIGFDYKVQAQFCCLPYQIIGIEQLLQ